MAQLGSAPRTASTASEGDAATVPPQRRSKRPAHRCIPGGSSPPAAGCSSAPALAAFMRKTSASRSSCSTSSNHPACGVNCNHFSTTSRAGPARRWTMVGSSVVNPGDVRYARWWDRASPGTETDGRRRERGAGLAGVAAPGRCDRHPRRLPAECNIRSGPGGYGLAGSHRTGRGNPGVPYAPESVGFRADHSDNLGERATGADRRNCRCAGVGSAPALTPFGNRAPSGVHGSGRPARYTTR